MILFNKPPYVGKEVDYIKEAIENQKICGDGPFTKKCDKWMEEKIWNKKSASYHKWIHCVRYGSFFM